jgi:calcineurin-like phosphoesterase family protein
MSEFFASDHHFNHLRMATMRGFATMEEMNEKIIENHNKVVKGNDTTYLLGDFTFRQDPENFIKRMNGHFYFVFGNHDAREIRHPKIIHSVKGFYDIKLHDQKITLCHYPMVTWNCSHYGAWNLHGHHHHPTIIQEKFPGKRMNVAMEAINLTPVSFDEVVAYMDKQPDNWDLIKRGEARKE